MMKTWKLVSCVAAMAFSVSTQATSVEENTPFAALQWSFGEESVKPDVVIGYRSVDVETDGDVSGWQGSVSYRPHRGVNTIKLEGVRGDEDMQFTFGGGYSLKHHKPIVTGGVTGSHLIGGADYVIGHHKIEPYVGITTLSDYDVPKAPTSNNNKANANNTSTNNNQSSANNGTPQTVVNNNVQAEVFPEYKDCNC